MAPNNEPEPPINPCPRAAVTFSLAPQSSFSYCTRCAKPIVTVGKRKESHECSEPTSAPPSRKSSVVAGWFADTVLAFLFSEKAKKADDIPDRAPRRVDTISLRRTMTCADPTSRSSSQPPVNTDRILRNSIS